MCFDVPKPLVNSRDRTDENVAEVHRILAFGFLQSLEEEIPGAVIDVGLVLALAGRIQRLARFGSLFLDVLPTHLLERAFGLAESQLDSVHITPGLCDPSLHLLDDGAHLVEPKTENEHNPSFRDPVTREACGRHSEPRAPARRVDSSTAAVSRITF